MSGSDHDKIQLVHDALAECKNSDQLYLLIHEHYTDATYSCSRELRTKCERLIGALVIQAISVLEKRVEAQKLQCDGDTDYDRWLESEADARNVEEREARRSFVSSNHNQPRHGGAKGNDDRRVDDRILELRENRNE